ncbi:hypothetical protein M2459_002489 [Parabacteroides sp. PF5-5]|uniref:hypothetical protein n=1 Tax=unclassified Parabacteroides TaxID=2649774 RepID=UPI002472FD06|nr:MULTISPECIES: hypothetical protein [unclassified Parabacteroides]MDH6305755.1 hypothetical protein [Parabacteroides sp. PH5-39]MDH6316827.1 hypothetical protein [Parabacteroides sp. PF5-13]MDH6320468.1 hypothetical protein [Parabacteroides sp. PH5-13]MDH6324198.1 hypothetical protein [Parabacteroides sp. PH5-8]MDH6328013.1 hypothetical protein [Parabacteroides sp. PH5-41]
MSKQTEEKDILKTLFGRMPEADLPASFRDNVMRQVFAEALKVKRRNECFALLSVIVASVAIIALAVVSLVYMDLPKMAISLPDLSSVPFYLYIGMLTLLLLFGDYKMRKTYRKKHSEK